MTKRTSSRANSLTAITVWFIASAGPTMAQAQTDMKPFLDRLDRIERENDALRQGNPALRGGLHAVAAPDTGERIAVQESRTQELAQTKVEASQRFPISITGMVLANAFINSKQNGGVDYSTIAYNA